MERFSEHKGYVNNNKLNQATGAHFNLPGHSISDMSIMAIQKVYNRGAPYRKELEKEEISKFRSFRHGINKNAGGVWGEKIANCNQFFPPDHLELDQLILYMSIL